MTVNSVWVNSDKKGSNSKGNFIILSKEKEQNFFSKNSIMLAKDNPNPTVIPSNFSHILMERKKENIPFSSNSEQNMNVPNIMNITDDLSKKCNLTLDKNENFFSGNILNNSAMEFKGSGNYNCKHKLITKC
jgi:hypothetical protein